MNGPSEAEIEAVAFSLYGKDWDRSDDSKAKVRTALIAGRATHTLRRKQITGSKDERAYAAEALREAAASAREHDPEVGIFRNEDCAHLCESIAEAIENDEMYLNWHQV